MRPFWGNLGRSPKSSLSFEQNPGDSKSHRQKARGTMLVSTQVCQPRSVSEYLRRRLNGRSVQSRLIRAQSLFHALPRHGDAAQEPGYGRSTQELPPVGRRAGQPRAGFAVRRSARRRPGVFLARSDPAARPLPLPRPLRPGAARPTAVRCDHGNADETTSRHQPARPSIAVGPWGK